MIIKEHFVLAVPLDSALTLFDDVPEVIACIPGARVIERNADGSYSAVIAAKYGEIGVEFSGTVTVERIEPSSLRVRAQGHDGRSVGASGDIKLVCVATDAGQTTVDLAASFSFTGMLTTLAYSATRVVGPQLMHNFAACLAARAAATVA